MAHHKLKLEQPFFDDKRQDRKDWEIRKNDRNFKVGDTVDFQKYPVIIGVEMYYQNCEILTLLEGGKYGLEEGYCIFQHTKGKIDFKVDRSKHGY